ncbi:MAG: hypothetical protein ACO2PN_09420 [Pyrobaculum sp.]|jgi:hypothetical protein
MIPDQNTAVRGLLTAGIAAAVVVFVLLLAAEQTSVGAAPDAGQAYRDVSHVRR